MYIHYECSDITVSLIGQSRQEPRSLQSLSLYQIHPLVLQVTVPSNFTVVVSLIVDFKGKKEPLWRMCGL